MIFFLEKGKRSWITRDGDGGGGCQAVRRIVVVGGGCVTCIYAAAVWCVRGGCARARLFCMQDTTILHVSGAGAKEGRLPELWSAAAVYVRPANVEGYEGTCGERADVWKSI
jgi:hypothetical protein